MGAFAMTADRMQRDTDPLVASARAGDLQAFEALYRAFSGRVFAICMRISGERSQAEDLSQETFVRAWQSLGTYQLGTNFSAWISRVAVNTSLSARRSQGRRTARETTVESLPEPQIRDVDRPARSPKIDLERAIAQLPSSARKVFVLHDVEGYQHREIAQLLGVATGTSKAQLHRARTALRKALNS